MTIVLVLLLLGAVVGGVWSSHRYHQVSEWDRELAAAFASHQRGDIPRHRAVSKHGL
jgi:hypothetical protein